jgi:hypothetical protein
MTSAVSFWFEAGRQIASQHTVGNTVRVRPNSGRPDRFTFHPTRSESANNGSVAISITTYLNASPHSSVLALPDTSFSSRESDSFVTPTEAGPSDSVSCCRTSRNVPGVLTHMISEVGGSGEVITGDSDKDESVLSGTK